MAWLAAALLLILPAPVARAADPASATIAPGETLSWDGASYIAGANTSNTLDPQRCNPSYPGGPNDETPPTGDRQCDVFEFTFNAPPDYWAANKGGLAINIDWSDGGDEDDDFDMFIYEKPPAGQPVGAPVAGSEQGATTEEHAKLFSPRPGQPYLVRVNPWSVTNVDYVGQISFFSLAPIPAVAGGIDQYRASSTGFRSYSEPHISVDPLDPNHLVAGSKMYQDLGRYLFKIGTFASFDGGLTWRDNGHLPGYPDQTGAEPADEYWVTSDIWTAFDDEGNAYAMVLDHPPNDSLTGAGWGMTLHKSTDGGRTWSDRIPIEEKNDFTKQTLLSDKNTMVVDNFGPDRDGKTGNIYACWSEDAPVANLFVAVKRSTDGGQTWPQESTNVSGADRTVIGCHVVVGPPETPGGPGVVYIFWLDFAGDGRYRMAKSTDGGQTFSPPKTVRDIRQLPRLFPNSAFRNFSLPSAAVDPDDGTVYLSWADYHATQPDEECPETAEDEPVAGQVCDADILIVKSNDGGTTWAEPVRVNQDPLGNGKDQFQQWLAVTDSGQLNMMWFDRRNDPQNFYIDTFFARSNDDGTTWKETRVTRSMWDPTINPPISGSGHFIGDYQGLAATDCTAVPFWNDTSLANLSASDPRYSQYQEAFAAVIPNTPEFGGTAMPASCPRPAARPEADSPGCVNFLRGVRGRRLGPARLGERRSTHRRRFKGARLRVRPGMDRYCIAGGGSLRIGYPTRRLNRRLRAAERRRVRHRAVLILTTSKRYRIKRITAGTRVRVLRRRLRGERRLRVGRNVWYLASARKSRLVFKARGGRVREVGLADRRLTHGRRGARRLLRAWERPR